MTSPRDEPTGRRQVALAVIAFVATLILLAGLVSVIGRSGPGTTASASASSSASSSPSAPTGSATPRSSAKPSSSPVAPSPSGSAPVAEPSPSAPAEGDDAVLVGAGDIGDCDTTGDTATAKLIAGITGTVFTAGDNAYPSGRAQDFTDCYDPAWGSFKDRTRPAPGNHDWVTKGLKGYLDYFGTAAAPHGTPWYSYDLGTWHIVVLDSMCGDTGGCGKGSEQGKWLSADLAASDARCTLAVWHHPRFSSGEHGNNRGVGTFWQALYAAGADVVINGHDHDYERFKPQDPAGHEDRARGIREFVVGTGGAELRGFNDAKPNSELRAPPTNGVLKLVLHPDTYDWRFIPTEGDFSDSGSALCH